MAMKRAITLSAVCTTISRGPPVIFGRLGDQTPYLYLGGRITRLME
jgi:hypothetical protein